MRWTFRQRRLQELLTVPESERPDGCKTDAEIATTLGVALNTLKGWRLTPGWWEEVSNIASAYIGEHLAEIYEAMVKQAIGGSVQAANFCRSVLNLENKDFNISVKHYDDDRLIVFLPAEKGPPMALPPLELPALEGKVIASKPVEEKEDELVVIL